MILLSIVDINTNRVKEITYNGYEIDIYSKLNDHYLYIDNRKVLKVESNSLLEETKMTYFNNNLDIEITILPLNRVRVYLNGKVIN